METFAGAQKGLNERYSTILRSADQGPLNEGDVMKNQSKKTRIRTSKTDAAVNGESTPIKPKCSMPERYQTNRKRQPDRLAGDQTLYAPTSNSIQVKKQPKELKK